MAKKFRVLAWERLTASAGSFRVRGLALHRHLPKLDHLGEHEHPHWQVLAYLDGRGAQKIGGHRHEVSAGTCVLLPPRTPHSFVRLRERPPLCLVISFEWRRPSIRKMRVTTVASEERMRLEQLLAGMTVGRDSGVASDLERGAASLQILHHTLRAMGCFGRPPATPLAPGVRRIQRLLAQPAAAQQPVAELARQCGHQRDYLNRLSKSETGLTLRELRERQRLRDAMDHLRAHDSIGDAAEAGGFADQNYFARWFRKQTGRTPSQWRSESLANQTSIVT